MDQDRHNGDVVDQMGPHDAWIAPDGTIYYVEECSHEDTAYILHRVRAYDLEERGWIHVSRFWTGYIVVRDGFSPTGEQTARIWETIHLASQMPDDEPLQSIARMMREYVQVDYDLLAEASLSDIWYGIGYYG